MAIPDNYFWNEENEKFIVENWQKMTDKELAEELNYSPGATTEKRYGLGLKRFEIIYWEPKEVEYLIKNYKIKGDSELARDLMILTGKEFTKKRIEKKRRSALNLIRTEEEILAILAHNKASINQNPNYINAKIKIKETLEKRKSDNIQKWESFNLRICELRNELIKLNSPLNNHNSNCIPQGVNNIDIINMENRKISLIKEIQVLNYKLSRLPANIINNADNRILKVAEWISVTSVLLCLKPNNKKETSK